MQIVEEYFHYNDIVFPKEINYYKLELSDEEASKLLNDERSSLAVDMISF